MVHLVLAIIYLSFISLGLPDAILGAAWPNMSSTMAVPVSYAGPVSMVMFVGTILSSLSCDRLTRRFGTGRVTAASVAITAAALLGFSVSSQYYQLLLWAIPYGLGAGCVDASLNHYVALHYASRHMSWLHCMWGLGASIGPSVMGAVLTRGIGWQTGYRAIGLFQLVLTGVLVLSLPLWKSRPSQPGSREKALSLGQVFRLSGAKTVILAFFCYIAVEQTCILWASSYLVLHGNLPEDVAASLGSLFLMGMTLGRFLSGFLTYRLSDKNMIRLGQGVMVLGAVVLLLPLGTGGAVVGLTAMGLGCAPIYPCIIHATPEHFGQENSQAVIGVQMAGAYTGGLVMPPLVGLMTRYLGPEMIPPYLLVVTALMVAACERLNRKPPAEEACQIEPDML